MWIVLSPIVDSVRSENPNSLIESVCRCTAKSAESAACSVLSMTVCCSCCSRMPVSEEMGIAVAVIMAARAQQEGRKLWWDPVAEEILDHAPPA